MSLRRRPFTSRAGLVPLLFGMLLVAGTKPAQAQVRIHLIAPVKGPLPTGNWLHQFDNFEDVIEPIQVQAFAGRPVEEAAMRRLLRKELRDILRKCLVRGTNSGSKAFSPRTAIYNFYATLPEP